MLTSTRYQVQYPSPDRADSADVPRDIGQVVTQGIERSMMYGQGAIASRPTSTPGTPGIQGRIYVSTDETPKKAYYDFGTGWAEIGAGVSSSGTAGARPSAPAAGSGALYYASDKDVLYQSDGTTWRRVGSQAGDLIATLNTSAAPGRVLAQGQTVSRTGIYDELFANWGTRFNTGGEAGTDFRLPDLQGRALVMLGTHGDVNAIGKSDNLIASSRSPRHNSQVNDPTHSHGVYDPTHGHGVNDPGHYHDIQAQQGINGPSAAGLMWVGSPTGYNTNVKTTGISIAAGPTGIGINGNSTGISVGPGGAARPADTIAYFVGNIEIKL